MNTGPDSDRRDDSQLERRAKALFEERAEALAPDVVQRLTRARAAAVAEVSRPRVSSRFSWLTMRWLTMPRATQWVALGGGAAALSALLVVLRFGPMLERMPQGLGAEDVEFVAGMNTNGDDIEMLQDLEFYSWLGPEPAVEDGGSDENIG